MKLVDLDKLLPADIPEGERVLWFGRPEWVSLARNAYRANWVAAYFGVLTLPAAPADHWLPAGLARHLESLFLRSRLGANEARWRASVERAAVLAADDGGARTFLPPCAIGLAGRVDESEPYVWLGQLEYVKHDPRSHPVEVVWRLKSFDALLAAKDGAGAPGARFRALVKAAGV